MKKTASPASPAQPASNTPDAAATNVNEQPSQAPAPAEDSAIPPEILECAQLEEKFLSLVALRDDMDVLAEESLQKLRESLLSVDLRNPDALQAITNLHSQTILAPMKSEALEVPLKGMQKELHQSRVRANEALTRAVMEASRGVHELEAQKLFKLDIFDLYDARRTTEMTPAVKIWRAKEINYQSSDRDNINPIGAEILEVAKEVFAELPKLRAALNGQIPSAVEMHTQT